MNIQISKNITIERVERSQSTRLQKEEFAQNGRKLNVVKKKLVRRNW